MERTAADYVWIIVGSALVFMMQAGFVMVESGLTRSKNSINVAIKHLTGFGISTLCTTVEPAKSVKPSLPSQPAAALSKKPPHAQ
jgi:hypothetical protein